MKTKIVTKFVTNETGFKMADNGYPKQCIDMVTDDKMVKTKFIDAFAGLAQLVEQLICNQTCIY